MTSLARTDPATIVRDRWKRPLIVPLDGGDPVPYTRVSTLAKTLDDLNGLMAWKCRKTAEGLIRRPDLLTRVSGILANGDPDTDWPTKRGLNDVVDEATEAAGATTGRSSGTGFHALIEAILRGEEPDFILEPDRIRVDAFRAATAELEPVALETFVVVDEVRAAGSFDHLWRCPDGRVRVGDLKSGKSEKDYPLATAIQLATYAHGARYDFATGERSPLHPDLDDTTGLLIHMPPSGGCEVVPLNLEIGWDAAQVAATVRGIRALKAVDVVRRAS